MEKKEIIDYVTFTPHNTNPAILSQKLDELIRDSGGATSVSFEYQYLTEEQKMQARENLGLYYRTGAEKQLASYIYHEDNIEDNVYYSSVYEVNVQYYDYKTDETKILKINQQSERSYIPMAGEDILYWYGNCNLIPKEHLGNTFAGLEETQYADLPFVLYQISGELELAKFDGTYIEVDVEGLKKLQNIDSDYEIEINFYDPNDLTYTYYPIPREYLPPVTVTSPNGNTYQIIVDDEGNLTTERYWG